MFMKGGFALSVLTEISTEQFQSINIFFKECKLMMDMKSCDHAVRDGTFIGSLGRLNHRRSTFGPTFYLIIMSPPCKGWETYCFSPCVCVSVGLSVRHKIVSAL